MLSMSCGGCVVTMLDVPTSCQSLECKSLGSNGILLRSARVVRSKMVPNVQKKPTETHIDRWHPWKVLIWMVSKTSIGPLEGGDLHLRRSILQDPFEDESQATNPNEAQPWRQFGIYLED